jgi:hypothetical protein
LAASFAGFLSRSVRKDDLRWYCVGRNPKPVTVVFFEMGHPPCMD